MKRQLLHTPEGVRDIYNSECEKKLVLQDRLRKVLEHYGYHMIQTPTFEFFDIFGREVGTKPSKELYKFFDREGNTLVLRPDITPAIARAASKYYMDETMPVRLCYVGNTYINYKRYQGHLKETTQLGAELINDHSAMADAEIIAMAVDSLKESGLKDFQISVGHAEFFQGLAEAAGLNEEQEEELRGLINNKNFFGVEEFVSKLEISDELRQLFAMLNGFYDSAEEILAAKKLAAVYPKVLASIEYLEQLHRVMECYDIDKYVTFELGLISDYQYYTGIIFSGYTFGSGEPIVKGGRYDKLLSRFGKEAPAVGFAIVVDQLMAALSRQKIAIPVEEERQLVLYAEKQREKAVAFAREQRAQGASIELLQKESRWNAADYEAYAKKHHIAKIIDMEGAE